MFRFPDPRTLFAHVRSLWRGLFRHSEVEAEMREEFRHHIELRTEHLVRTGMSRREAAHRARLEFGHVERHREEARSARGLGPFDRIRFSWIDVKLGVRSMP